MPAARPPERANLIFLGQQAAVMARHAIQPVFDGAVGLFRIADDFGWPLVDAAPFAIDQQVALQTVRQTRSFLSYAGRCGPVQVTEVEVLVELASKKRALLFALAPMVAGYLDAAYTSLGKWV